MLKKLRFVLNDSSEQVKAKVIGLYIMLVTFNLVAWILTFFASSQYPFVLSTGLLAFTFGLRHGVDADHIAAIDNVTRKLMQDGKRPVAIGFFFSLGHSTIVVALSILVALTTSVVQNNFADLKEVGGLVSTGVSAAFLYLIGIINLIVLVDIFRMFRQVTKGNGYSETSLNTFLAERGFLNRFFGPLARAIDTSWKMYPLGILFGLGFETAGEVALLGIAASTAGNGMPVIYVMLFPLLFAAGMTLVDTTDSILMLGAYGWAFVKPIRKLYYNLNITLVSVLVALLIGTIEVMSIFAERFNLDDGLWGWSKNLSFETMGYIIIGVFIFSWLGSTAIYKLRRYDDIEVRVNP